MKHRLPTVCSALFFALHVTTTQAGAPNESGPLVQISFGILELDSQTASKDGESQGALDIDFSTLPSGGLEAEYAFAKGWVHWGLNPGANVSWKTDDTRLSGRLIDGSGSTVVLEADSSLFLAEIHLGGYVRGRLDDRITTYAAAGPMVMYGSHDLNNESSTYAPPQITPSGTVVFEETDSSDINIGYYLRAGIDFRIQQNQYIGFGVRYMSTELDFNKTVGKLDIKGPLYLLTFTTQL
ncbi:MAG: outer membrane beta-barrel protein [Halioglobus sp.]|nr:outer membrane beta-barrel protein [Halioglobus sp.]